MAGGKLVGYLQVQLGSQTRDYQDQIQRVVRAGLEPGISGSQGKRPNHWATLFPCNPVSCNVNICKLNKTVEPQNKPNGKRFELQGSWKHRSTYKFKHVETFGWVGGKKVRNGAPTKNNCTT